MVKKALVLCDKCAEEPSAKKTSSWDIVYPPRSEDQKHKVPRSKHQTEKDECKTKCVCV